MTTTAAGASRLYETMFIAPPTLGEADVEKLVTSVTDSLTSRGAEVVLVERWGRRKLAYLIRRHAEGWYVLLHIRGNGEAIAEAERRMRINENFLKYMSVRIDHLPGAEEAGVQRLARRAKQEEERAQRAADRAAAATSEGDDDDDERPRARRRSRDDDDDDADEDGDND